MRKFFSILLILFATASRAQTLFPTASQNNLYDAGIFYNQNLHERAINKSWFVSGYHTITAGYSFFNGGSANFVAAPIGLQLSHRITNNLYGFAGINVTPMYANFNTAFINSDANKINGFNSVNRPGIFSMYPTATMGLMYINNDKTFSVSGSISVERGGYPLYLNNQAIPSMQNNGLPNR